MTLPTWSLVESRIRKEHLHDPSTRWETVMEAATPVVRRYPWHKGKIVGEAPLKQRWRETAGPNMVQMA
jgi:hypothetical protein